MRCDRFSYVSWLYLNQAFQNAPKQGERPLEQRLARLLPSPQTVDETPQKTIRNKVNVSDSLRLEIIRLAQMGMSRQKIKDALGLLVSNISPCNV